MEVVMIDAFDFESRRELVMVFGNFATAKMVHLGLHWNCRTGSEDRRCRHRCER
jgi:hypothetical protein